jgi:hypothetical protein
MRTPAGKDCKFYYADYNRGRNVQECRLIAANPDSLLWRPQLCALCPVPEILNANASPTLEFQLTVKPRLLGLGRRVEVQASCGKHRVALADPFVGCPDCHAERPGLDVFWQALKRSDED